MFPDRIDAAQSLARALAQYRGQNPLVLAIPRGAVPVAAPQSLDAVAPYADAVVCLQAPIEFQAVEQFYRSFTQVEDETVITTLAESRAAAAKIKAP